MDNLNLILVFSALAELAVLIVLISSYQRRGKRIRSLKGNMQIAQAEKQKEIDQAKKDADLFQKEAAVAREKIEKSRYNIVQLIQISNEEAMGVKAENLVRVIKANGYREITNFLEDPKDLCGMESQEFAIKRTERWLKDAFKEASIEKFLIIMILRSGTEEGGYRGWLLAKQPLGE